MLKKGSKVNSILTGSCPKCQNENMYVDTNPYHLGKVLKMHENCSHCGLKYQIEPSFFYGAMYVSYAVNVAMGVATFIVAKLFIGLDLVQSFAAITVSLVVLYPIVLRLSRNIYINLFVDYEPTLKE